MKLPNDRTVFTVLALTIGGVIFCLGIEAMFVSSGGGEIGSPEAFEGLIVATLVLVLIVLVFFREKSRHVQATAQSRELMAMQREVDKTERRYQSLLECAGDAIFVIRFDDGKLAEVNQAGTDLLGFSRGELGRLTGWDLIPEAEQKVFTAFVLRVKRSGAAGPQCITFRRKDGSTFFGEVNARLIDLDDERVVQAIIRDITLNRQAEQEIRLRNRRLSILNNIIIRASQNLDLPAVLDVTLHETLASFGADAGTVHLVDGSGRFGTLAAASNISECHLAEARPGEVPGGAPCPLVICQQCSVYASVGHKSCGMSAIALNHGWRSVVGVPLLAKKRLIGVMHIMAVSGREHTLDDLKFFTTMGNQIGIIIEHARLFAELNWKTEELLRSHGLLEKSSHQLAHSQQRLRKNLALVERANAELERLNRMKNNFLGMISHEFKTPLTGILGSAEFLLTRRSTDRMDEERKLLETIHECGNRLNGIVSDLLKVVRLEAESVPVTKTPLHLAEIMDLMQEQLAPLLTERQQSLSLPDLSALPYFHGDRESLLEVFVRLLENAVKFSPDGGEIAIAARVVDRHSLEDKREVMDCFNAGFYTQMGRYSFLQVEVRDRGVGINPEEQFRIFDKFYEIGDIRFHSSGKSKFQGKGTGLGLTIVKGMVEAHRGMIWVESSRDSAGSSFFLLLPLEEGSNQQAFPFMQPDSAVLQQRSFEEYQEDCSRVFADRESIVRADGD